jgi:hypothetical protein
MILDIWHYKIQSLEGTFTFNNFFDGIGEVQGFDPFASKNKKNSGLGRSWTL